MYRMMTSSVFCLVLWMLLCAVNAVITNFADTSTMPDITTPMAEMASRRTSGGEGASGDGADALGGAFHQVAQGLLRVQEALRLQQHQAERTAQEALRLLQHRAETALRDAKRHMDQKLRDRDEAMVKLREECSFSIKKMETKVKTMEERFVPSSRRKEGGHVSITQLESIMDTLVVKLKEAFEQLFLNTKALIEHFKRFSPSQASSAVTVAPTTPSKFISTVTPPSAATSPSPSSFLSPFSASPTSVSSPNSTSRTACTSPSPSSSHSSSPSFTTPSSISLTAYPSSFPSSSQSPSSSLSTPTSTTTSTPNTTSSSTSSRLPATCDEECEKQRVQLKIRELKKRARRGPSALMEQLLNASRTGNLEDVRRLLDAGADVNSMDWAGRSPLMWSVSESEITEAVVSLLLQKGAIVNAVNVIGWTALHWAALFERSGRGVTLLLGAGADVDARQVYGETPLHFAADGSNEAAVRALLASGARKDLKPWSGRWMMKTPFDLATSDTIRKLLRP